MPTTKPGDAEPGQPTRVTPNNCHMLFDIKEPKTDENDSERVLNWREILETIARWQVERVECGSRDVNENLKQKTTSSIASGPTKFVRQLFGSSSSVRKPMATDAVLPRIDHGRVHFFIEFWQNHPRTEPWLKEVCQKLGKYDWGHG